VRIQTVNDEIAESVGLNQAGGALVASVTAEGPAAAAGVQVGDIVLSFDGQDVTAMRQLPKLVAGTPIDKEVEIVVQRKGERLTFKVKVGRLEEEAKTPPGAKPDKSGDPERPRKKSSLGLSFSAMTDELRSRYGIDRAVNGVVITEVDPESPVAEKEVKVGTVVVEVTHEKVSALLLVSDGQGELSFVAIGISD